MTHCHFFLFVLQLYFDFFDFSMEGFVNLQLVLDYLASVYNGGVISIAYDLSNLGGRVASMLFG